MLFFFSSEQNGRVYSEGRFINHGRPVTLKSPSERFHKVFLKVADGIYQIVWQTKRYLPSYLLITLKESQKWKDNYNRCSTNSLNVLVGFPCILTFLMVFFLTINSNTSLHIILL